MRRHLIAFLLCVTLAVAPPPVKPAICDGIAAAFGSDCVLNTNERRSAHRLSCHSR